MNLKTPSRTDPIAPSQSHIGRRQLLYGLGVAIGLPFLVSLRPKARFAARTLPFSSPGSTQTGAPLRTAFIYFPNGAISSAWWPTGATTKFPLSRTLKPLENVKGSIQVLGGLDNQTANAGPNGIDGGGAHARATGTFLSGVRLKKSETEIQAGISIDQVLASQIGPFTRFASLELGCDSVRRAAACDSGYSCAYQYNLSWNSPATPVSPESNPRLVFERLFGNGAINERQVNLLRRQKEQRSILDFVIEDARAMQRRLNPQDKVNLDQYLSSIRETEIRIVKAEQFGATKDPGIKAPAGIPSDYTEYVQLMYEMLFLAFQSDSTRVASFLINHDGSNRSFEHIGITQGHHDLSHHQNRPDLIEKVANIERWYVIQLAQFLEKLQATKDNDGNSLLFNSMIVYGSGCGDGYNHTHTNVPLLLAGNGGGTLTPGRYVKFDSKPVTNLYLDIADRVGIQGLNRLGDSTGRLGL